MNRTMARGDRNDIDLVAAHRGGEQGAFAELILRYDSRLRGMCWRYLRDADLVDDVLQDTFCHVLERVHSVDDGFNVAAWIHRIAANLCIDELRRRARRNEAHAPEGSERALLAVLDSDQRGRPEEALALDVTRALVRKAMLELPARQRAVLLLRDVHGLSEQATARKLRLSTGSVQGLLHRARNKFKEVYVSLDSETDLPPECGEVAFIFEHLCLRSLRQDRFGVVQRHLSTCAECEQRFAAALAVHLRHRTVTASSCDETTAA
jgi:RNA polymerase sigma-70 factor, ECF subfamily